MTALLPTVFAGLALCASTVGQLPDSAPPLRGTTEPGGGPIRLAGLHHERGRLLGVGPRYKAWLDSDGFTFVPALGRRAPREMPLRFALSEVGRGSELRSVASIEPEKDGHVARYRRTGFEERYEMRPEGMEQSFVFDALPDGTGDLVVRGRIDTDLHVERDGSGLRLSLPEVGSFTIGGVTGIDAEGKTCAGSLRLHGELLELSLPQEFVERAAMPLVLDPLIGGVTPIGQLQDNEFPDIAYNQLHDRYLVVWHVEFSGTTSDIAGAVIESDGTPYGSLIPIESGADRATLPAVATIASQPAFAVVWKNHTTGDLIGRGVSVLGTMNSPVTAYDATSQVSSYDLGGEGTTADDEVILVLVESDKVRARQINIGTGYVLTPFSAVVDITDATHDDLSVSISASGGTTGRHCITWSRRISNGPSAIYAAIVSRNLSILDDSIVITGTLPSNSASSVDGDGNRWVVAYSKRDLSASGFSFDIYCRTVAYDPYRPAGDRGVAGLTEIPVESNANDDEAYPDVAWLGESVLITYLDLDSGSWTAYAKSFDPFDCAICEGEFTVNTSGTTDAWVAVASQFSGNPDSGLDQALIAFHSQASGTLSQVEIRRFEAVDGVVSDSIGGGCGRGGTPRAGCVRVGNGGFDLRLLNAAPSVPAYIVAGARADFGYACSSCILQVDPFAGFIAGPFATSASGDAATQVAIPNDSSLDGVTFYAQWLALDPTPLCGELGVEMSDTLSIQIQQ